MGRKVGSGNVMVNGKIMTTQDYENVVVSALEHNGNNWMTVDQMVLWGSTHKMCEKKDAPREATTHPLWKVVSMMMYDVPFANRRLERKREHGRYMYKLSDPTKVYVNGEEYDLTED